LDTPSGQELFNAQMTLTGLGVPFLLADRDKVTFTKVLFGTNINGGLVYVPISLLEDARTLLASGGDAMEEDSEELPGDLQE
ncbi:MAG: hypothetical protein LBR85_09750, partial [Oscillospiraceae bacterium]|nr:hypothetical protein [Oscillospiraceae bacterium]